jgi:hypothetical protein
MQPQTMNAAMIEQKIQSCICCMWCSPSPNTISYDKKILEELANAWEKIAALRERDIIDAKDSNRT